VGIVCALRTEARHLQPTLRRPAKPLLALSSLSDGTLLAVSGMGPDAAAAGARALLQAGASALASFGLAGGLDPTLAAGDICLPREVMATHLPAIATTRRWRDRVGAALIALLPQGHVIDGSLISSSDLVSSVAAKTALFGATGAHAVDMESFAVAEVASTHRLPFIALRVVVDRATDELPPAIAAAADVAGEIRPWRLLAALARSPAELAPLMRLGRRYRAASQSLSAIARVGAWSQLAFS
jgi:hopanoid-associated phosphorylase